ncbi:MAG TPA: aromatic ring-hydroxylating dioxygenase subunit alpha [Stellaceae bacterium]|jgi:vanillate O-demethylase monooxygenase subunit|nr:aromatic ring-hydroxylating dioxygenase subunit alpha [Stellaceae bacterium]
MEALRNHWYCAAFGHELQQTPMARTFNNEPVVMYRRTDGAPVAFEDRCCHRRAPLSAGKVEGDNLRCGYHGLVYEPSGKVIWAPGQDHLPPGARVRAYPIVEKHGWVWIWLGDPAIAASVPPPNYDKYDDPNWASYSELLPMKSNYFLVVDNLLDLSHLPFLHAATIGSPEDTNPKLTWERGGDWIKGTRVARGLSPSQRNLMEGLDFKFDRTQIMLFEPPSQVTIDILSNEYGKEYGDPTSRMNRRIIIYDAITPETDTTSHYFWAISRDYAIHDRAMTELGLKATGTAFREDQAMLEKQQRTIDRDPHAAQIDLVGDSGGLQARRIIERLLLEERDAARAAE